MPPYDILKQGWKFEYMDFSELRGKFQDIANFKEDKMNNTSFSWEHNPDRSLGRVELDESSDHIRKCIEQNANFWFNGNHVIYSGIYGSPRTCLTLPKGIDAEQNKFGAVCKAIVTIYTHDCNDYSNFVTPVDSYTDDNTHVTSVLFSDGTEVSCRPVEIDLLQAVANKDYFGVYICYAKKILGSTSAIRGILKKCDYAARKKEIRQLNKEHRRKIQEENRRFEKEAFEYEVKQAMKRFRVEREANRRLDIEEARKAKKSQE